MDRIARADSSPLHPVDLPSSSPSRSPRIPSSPTRPPLCLVFLPSATPSLLPPTLWSSSLHHVQPRVTLATSKPRPDLARRPPPPLPIPHLPIAGPERAPYQPHAALSLHRGVDRSACELRDVGADVQIWLALVDGGLGASALTAPRARGAQSAHGRSANGRERMRKHASGGPVVEQTAAAITAWRKSEDRRPCAAPGVPVHPAPHQPQSNHLSAKSVLHRQLSPSSSNLLPRTFLLFHSSLVSASPSRHHPIRFGFLGAVATRW